MKLQLSQLEGCFEGIIPAKIATCSKAGVPNASYLSHVYQVDQDHIATSYQFFNKTRANLLENPFASIQIRHPATYQAYRLNVQYLRSEEQGPIFNKMSVKLDVIAASEGMGLVFKLKAADIYKVLSIEELAGKSTGSAPQECPMEKLADLELMRVISEKLSRAQDMEELFDLSLALLNRYLGWTHMALLLADDNEKALITHDTFGYPSGGVGSEVPWGQGLIGLCAQHLKPFQISGLSEGLRYAQAVKNSLSVASPDARIPFPGIANPTSQIAAPILAHGELVGVLFLESETQSYWATRDVLFLSTMANILGLGIRSFEGRPGAMRPLPIRSSSSSMNDWRFRYVEGEDVIFVNDQYLIKNIPARILRYLITTYLSQGRTEFSNMELRAEKGLQLPEIKDNLEARLILLRKRLDEQGCGLRLVSSARGKFKLEVSGKVSFS